jgi:uroporphyrinogen-III synthase
MRLLAIAPPLLRKYKPELNILGVYPQSYGGPLSYILLTRPRDQALSFAEELVKLGMIPKNIVIDPIQKIEGVEISYDFTSVRGLLITSANGVAYLPADLIGSNLPTFCVGKATTRAALKRGLMAQHLAATAQGLCNVLSAQVPQGPLLHLRGTHTSLDFEVYFCDTPVGVQNLITYRQTTQELGFETYKLLRGTNPIVLPVFSARTARLLCELDLNWALHTCVVISEEVADPCRAAGFGKVIVSAEPTAGSMLGALTPFLVAKGS